MPLYSPFPLFTLVGFTIHSVVMLSIAVRLLRRHSSRAVIYLGVGVLAYAVDFILITILFFLFPNTITKTHIFAFIASVLVPIGTLFLVLSVSAVNPRHEKIGWAVFILGCMSVWYSYSEVLLKLKDAMKIEYSYVHPAYPLAITQSQGIGGIVGTAIICLFFLYQAFQSTLIVRNRAIVIGVASFLLGVSSFYWMSSTPNMYLITHTVGPLGSIILAIGFFAFDMPRESSGSNSKSS
ncbi:MAG: hypothetical protein AAB783_01325 [Patescibacteria group bacterium]